MFVYYTPDKTDGEKWGGGGGFLLFGNGAGGGLDLDKYAVRVF